MYESITFKIRGVSPLLLHNGQTANPLNPFSKRMKEVSGKRKKTDADYLELSRIEFAAGMYVNEAGEPVIPGENIEAAMIEGAKKQRLGESAKAGIISDGNWAIEYTGPKTVDELWEDKRFVDVRKVRIQQNSVMRTRPIFRAWGCTIKVDYLPEQLNRSQVIQIMETVGTTIGICDYTPKFGRFVVEKKN